MEDKYLWLVARALEAFFVLLGLGTGAALMLAICRPRRRHPAPRWTYDAPRVRQGDCPGGCSGGASARRDEANRRQVDADNAERLRHLHTDEPYPEPGVEVSTPQGDWIPVTKESVFARRER